MQWFVWCLRQKLFKITFQTPKVKMSWKSYFVKICIWKNTNDIITFFWVYSRICIVYCIISNQEITVSNCTFRALIFCRWRVIELLTYITNSELSPVHFLSNNKARKWLFKMMQKNLKVNACLLTRWMLTTERIYQR